MGNTRKRGKSLSLKHVHRPALKIKTSPVVKHEYRFRHSEEWKPEQISSSGSDSDGGSHDGRRRGTKRRKIYTVPSRSGSGDSARIEGRSSSQREAGQNGKEIHVSTWISEVKARTDGGGAVDPGVGHPPTIPDSVSFIENNADESESEYVIPSAPDGTGRKAMRLRPIVIDGNSIAWWHGRRTQYSAEGIRVCVEFFKNLGHSYVMVLTPDLKSLKITVHKKEVLEELKNDGFLKQIPNRIEDGNRIALLASHDNRKFILQHAAQLGGIIISNDDYQALKGDARESWIDTISNGILNFIFTTPEEIKFRSDRAIQPKSVDQLLAFP